MYTMYVFAMNTYVIHLKITTRVLQFLFFLLLSIDKVCALSPDETVKIIVCHFAFHLSVCNKNSLLIFFFGYHLCIFHSKIICY